MFHIGGGLNTEFELITLSYTLIFSWNGTSLIYLLAYKNGNFIWYTWVFTSYTKYHWQVYSVPLIYNEVCVNSLCPSICCEHERDTTFLQISSTSTSPI